jgi:hypothetical protein
MRGFVVLSVVFSKSCGSSCIPACVLHSPENHFFMYIAKFALQKSVVVPETDSEFSCSLPRRSHTRRDEGRSVFRVALLNPTMAGLHPINRVILEKPFDNSMPYRMISHPACRVLWLLFA